MRGGARRWRKKRQAKGEAASRPPVGKRRRASGRKSSTRTNPTNERTAATAGSDRSQESVGETSSSELLESDGALPASKLMSQFERRLRGSQFRYLNQSLYLSTGPASFAKFRKDAALFRAYHDGYLQSMRHWSVQPVDVAIRWLRKQPSHQRVVDYGCGEAKIMRSGLPHDVTPLDLVALTEGVIACDMGHSPLTSESQDIAIFSLSLMGTDYGQSLRDAARVLKLNGMMWIAEVCSRFADKSGKEDYTPFFRALEKLGFLKVLAKRPSPLFVVLLFRKIREDAGRIQWPVLKPCLYKKR